MNDLERLLNKTCITAENADDIRSFVDLLVVDDDISADRIRKYLSLMTTLFDQFVPGDLRLREATKNDMVSIVSRIQRSDYSDWTKRDRLFDGRPPTVLKQHYQSLIGEYPCLLFVRQVIDWKCRNGHPCHDIPCIP